MSFNASHITALNLSFNETNDHNISDINSPWLKRDEELAMKEVIVQGVLFAIALVGNSAVLIVLLSRRQKITRMFFFIFHLSVADLAVAFLNILSQMIWDITWRFLGDDFLCKTVKFLQVFSMYLSSWILTMMAFDRYMAICYPLHQYSWRARRCTIMICVAYLLSVLCSIPQIFVFSQKEILAGVFDCWATFIEPYGSLIYVAWFAFSIYIIPLIILCVTYGKITRTVWKVIRLKENGTLRIKSDGKTDVVKRQQPSPSLTRHSRTQPSITRQSFARSHSTYRRVYNKTKLVTVKMTATVIVVYFTCWTPFIFALLWTTFFPQVNIFGESVLTILLLLANLNSCTNPWIYLFFSLGKYVRCQNWQWQWRWRQSGLTTTAPSEQDELDPLPGCNYSTYSRHTIPLGKNTRQDVLEGTIL